MNDPLHTGASLSPAGEARRHAMRAELLTQVQLHKKRRYARRRNGAAALMIAILITAVFAAWPRKHTSPQRIADSSAAPAQPHVPVDVTDAHESEAAGTTPHIVRVHTDPAVLSRYRADTTLRLVQYLSDEELLHVLAEINRPAGLVRVQNTAWLTRPVADDAIENGL